MNYNTTISKNEFYRVGNIPVKVYRTKYGIKAFARENSKQRNFPMEIIWKKGAKISENEFLVLSSIIRSKIDRTAS